MPFLVSRKQVALELESVEGTAETLVDADVIAPVYDVEWSPTVEMYEREQVHASFSNISQIPGERYATISFSTELKGSGSAGTAPAHLSDPLQACGCAETIVGGTSVTYAPASSSLSSATLAVYEGDTASNFKKHMIHGARGTFSIEATKGLPVMIRFEFTGIYNEPTDGSALTSATDSDIPPAFLDTSFSFSSTSLKVESFTMDIGNEVVLRNDIREETGNFSAVIVNRTCTATIDPEEELAATFNYFDDWTNGDTGVLTWNIGSGGGDVCTFNAPVAQIVSVSPEDRDGIRTNSLDLQLNKSATAGDDEWTLAFT